MIRTHLPSPSHHTTAPTRQPCLGKRAAVGTRGRVQRHRARALDCGRQRSRHSAEQPRSPSSACTMPPHGAPRPARPRAGDGECFHLGQNLSFIFLQCAGISFHFALCFFFIFSENPFPLLSLEVPNKTPHRQPLRSRAPSTELLHHESTLHPPEQRNGWVKTFQLRPRA